MVRVSMTSMNVLVTGSEGLVGQTLVAAATASGHAVTALTRKDCDLTQLDRVRAAISAERPDVVIHAAGNVDGGALESDPDTAYRDNVLATQNVTLAAEDAGAATVYLSANLVFDGSLAHPQGYFESDPPAPRSVYARSKHAGEELTRSLTNRFYVVRTAWLFGKRAMPGRIDLPRRVLQMAEEGKPMTMVDDLHANPTYVSDLSRAILELAQTSAYGNYHLVNEGSASPLELARETLRLAGSDADVASAKLSFDGPVAPSPNTHLRNFAAAENLGIRLRPWREALRSYLLED